MYIIDLIVHYLCWERNNEKIINKGENRLRSLLPMWYGYVCEMYKRKCSPHVPYKWNTLISSLQEVYKNQYKTKLLGYHNPPSYYLRERLDYFGAIYACETHDKKYPNKRQ